MVVDHVQDLDLGPVGELPMGEVGLPPFVGHGGLEPDERAPRSLLRLRSDEAPPAEDPPDRGHRWDHGLRVALAQVVRDRVGTGIQSLVRQLLAQLDDLLLHGLGRSRR